MENSPPAITGVLKIQSKFVFYSTLFDSLYYIIHYSAHSPLERFCDRLHQVLRLLVLPTQPGLFIFTTIVIRGGKSIGTRNFFELKVLPKIFQKLFQHFEITLFTQLTSNNYSTLIFFCVGVVHSGEYDVCDVTLSVYPHRTSLKNMPGHGGNRTYDLWNTSPMLCQLSYAVRTVRFPKSYY